MTRTTHCALAIALVLVCTPLANAQSRDSQATRRAAPPVAVEEHVVEVTVDIFSAGGELVFESEPLRSEVFQWDMRDEQGHRVPDGVYLATITSTMSTGKVKKRVEQIVVGHERPTSAQVPAAEPVAPITGAGTGTATAGSIARFDDTYVIGDSIMTESAGNIGINTVAPTAGLHVNKGPLLPSVGNGRNGITLMQTSGGKGGSTTSPGQTGGRGSSVALVAGNGGDAVAGATNGRGGSITLQPGSPGTGGAGGAAGNVSLAPAGGNVGIGTTAPMRALQIGPSFDAAFTISPSDASPRAGFIRFGDNTGWRLIFGRSRESSGGPLNEGYDGWIMSLGDNGRLYVRGALQVGGFPAGPTGVGPLCRTLLNIITMCQGSSLRYKTDLGSYRNGMDLVDQLKPVTFTRKHNGMREVGLIAEDVAEVEPLLTYRNDNGEIEGVKYDLLPVVLVNALKEQQGAIKEQQKLIEQLQSRLSTLEGANK